MSIRLRLTLWHVALLTLTLAVWGGGTHALLQRSQRSHAVGTLRETWDGFARLVQTETREQPDASAVDVVREVVVEYRSRGWAAGVYDARGRRVAPTDADSALALPVWLRRGNAAGFGVVRDRGEVIARTFAAPVRIGGQPLTLVVARPTEEEQEVLEELRDAFLFSAPVILLLAGAGGYLLAVRALAPVDMMSGEASRIGAGNLHTRLPVRDPTGELGRLAAVFNELLARLEEAFERQRQFMADASHELRTPVAVIRGEAEVSLSRDDRTPGELREALQIAGEEATRLTRIVDDLFTLARADAGQYALLTEHFYLDELLHECARAVRTIAADARVEVRCDAPEEALIHADEGLVRRMVLNLLDNAIKHSHTGGTVRLSLRRTAGEYRIRVRDAGDGIPPEVQPHIFERFVRADMARTGGGRRSGAGLGLAIARWVAEAHGGRLDLTGTGPEGTEFGATFPAPSLPHGSATS